MMQMGGLDPSRLSAAVLEALRPFYFSDDVDPRVLAQAARHLNGESPRALFDLSLRLHWALPRRDPPPLLVLGAEGDRICLPDDVRATARHHGVEAVAGAGPRAHADARAGLRVGRDADAALAAHDRVAPGRQSGRRPDHASPSSARTPATSTLRGFQYGFAVASAAARSSPPSGMPIAARLRRDAELGHEVVEPAARPSAGRARARRAPSRPARPPR